MSTKVSRRPEKADIIRSTDDTSAEMSLDILEWLESERLEHENRMQELGCAPLSREKLSKPHEERDLSKSPESE